MVRTVGLQNRECLVHPLIIVNFILHAVERALMINTAEA
jgi:hypothetical protein